MQDEQSNWENAILDEIVDELSEDVEEQEHGYDILDFFQSIEESASEFSKNFDSTRIEKMFESIKSRRDEDIINSILDKKPNIFSTISKAEIEKYIKKLKQLSWESLSQLSFSENNELIAIMIAMLIEEFRRLSSNKKIKANVKQEIFIYFVANEIQSRLTELMMIIEDKHILAFDQQKIVAFCKNVHRIGYLEGLLDSEKKLRKYHSALVGAKHASLSKKITQDDMKKEITMRTKKMYQNGVNRSHNEVAKEIRAVIEDFLAKMNRGEKYNKNNPDYDKIFESIRKYKQISKKEWNDLINLFKKKKKGDKDIILKAVREGAPQKFIRGRNNVQN